MEKGSTATTTTNHGTSRSADPNTKGSSMRSRRADDVIRYTILKGNIVALREGMLYGGWIEILDDTIAGIHAAGTPLPTEAEARGQLAEHLEERHLALIGSSGEPPAAGSGGGAGAGEEEKRQPLDVPTPTASIAYSVVEVQGFILPGFVDIHNHGLAGSTEVLDHWSNPDVSRKLLAKAGTLSTLASVIFSTSRAKEVAGVVKAIESKVGEVDSNCCVLEGIHAEGPIIADYGGLPPAPVDMSLKSFQQLCETMPSLKIMTISPSKEAPAGFKRLQHLLSIGVRPALGHDRHASEADILGAIRLASEFVYQQDQQAPPGSPNGSGRLPLQKRTKKGRRQDEGSISTAAVSSVGNKDSSSSTFLPLSHLHTTHYCNVMGFHHRAPSLVNFALCPRFPSGGRKYRHCQPLTTEVIADLIHVHPLTIQALLSSREPKHVAAISDSISSYEPGKRLTYTKRSIVVRAEGGCYLCDQHGRPSPTLAGSTATLADQFYTLVTHFKLDLPTACKLVATTPAAIANINHVGAIEVGRKANLLVVDGELKAVTKRMVYGQWVEGVEPYILLRPSTSHL